jgi:hypothetical protein
MQGVILCGAVFFLVLGISATLGLSILVAWSSRL